jgi:SH3-like domain-containing protein
MKKYVIEIPCFSSIHEYPVSMRMIAYADRVDTTNKYLRKGEPTSIEAVYKFWRVVVVLFGLQHIRCANES